MLNIQLDIQPETAFRLKKLLDVLQDQEVFVKNFLEYQISELKNGLFNIRLDLDQFEKTYKISTNDFYNQFQEGKRDDREDYMIWAGLYEMYRENEKRLRELS